MKCPVCGTWTTVKETRTRKTDGVVTRRYECANLHRFSTEERVRYELINPALLSEKRAGT
jgi:transcriptional regulator NrdR family protein